MVVVELSGLIKLSSVVFGGFSQVVISNSQQSEPEISIGLRVFDPRWIVKVFHVHVASSLLGGRVSRLMRGERRPPYLPPGEGGPSPDDRKKRPGWRTSR
jgi:hypothetical protein